VLFLCNLFSGFAANPESIFKASRDNSEMREIRSELPIVLKSEGDSGEQEEPASDEKGFSYS
jgi:hypothetical protein